MRTVFDIATPEELSVLFGEDENSMDVEFHNHMRAVVQKDKNTHHKLLAELFANRGDMEQAEKNVDAITDDEYRLAVSLSLHELRL